MTYLAISGCLGGVATPKPVLSVKIIIIDINACLLPLDPPRASTIHDLSWENARVVLVGNKCDLSSRVVTSEQGNEFAQSLGVMYFETSAKEDVNVKQTFESLVDTISEKMAETIEKNPKLLPQSSRPRDHEPPQEKGGCGC